ncbi:MAG: hypothetical protein ACXVCK_01050 [Bdellovibrionota bacterium]
MKLELVPVGKYGEANSKEIFAVGERIRERGATTIAAFVPWSHLETDRHHLLQKLVKQCAASGLSLRLGISPELGIGYPNGGVPDELLRERQNLAQDRLGHPFYACVPPNIHPLVSLLAPAVFQRYGHFLLKLTQELSEVFTEGFETPVELVVSDSLFKHYRNTGLAAADHGDFSLRHMQFGAGYKKEEWTPALAERIFHSRAFDFLQSRFAKNGNVKVVSRNLFARDSSHGRLLEELVGSGPNHADLFKDVVRARAHCSIAWLDDLFRLRDRERNFLISSSLVIFGEIWLNEHDYFSLSAGFRAKMQKLVRGFTTEETELARPTIALSQNRFAPARISTLLQEKLGVALKLKTSLADINAHERKTTKLFVVEEGFSLELRQTHELLSFVRERDCTLVLFRSSLCESGLQELKKLKTFRLNHGWLFEIGIFPGGGHVLLIEGQEHSQLSMNTLGDSLVSVARIDPFCSFDRGESGLLSVTVNWDLNDESPEEKAKGEMKTLFLMNPETEAKKVSLEFASPVRIHGMQGGASAENGEPGGKCFETELPPLSVIPLSLFVERAPAEVAAAQEAEKAQDGTPAELA